LTKYKADDNSPRDWQLEKISAHNEQKKSGENVDKKAEKENSPD
jgi:hypothetical protein